MFFDDKSPPSRVPRGSFWIWWPTRRFCGRLNRPRFHFRCAFGPCRSSWSASSSSASEPASALPLRRRRSLAAVPTAGTASCARCASGALPAWPWFRPAVGGCS
uniref:(northern house mosquito) hypothetical protein n=1 Tax=Culex pipiens TaxID=7175 RepID=A0A8D8H517_CULPI